jgi:hypothetical protein
MALFLRHRRACPGDPRRQAAEALPQKGCIPMLAARRRPDVDARDERGHDE